MFHKTFTFTSATVMAVKCLPSTVALFLEDNEVFCEEDQDGCKWQVTAELWRIFPPVFSVFLHIASFISTPTPHPCFCFVLFFRGVRVGGSLPTNEVYML